MTYVRKARVQRGISRASLAQQAGVSIGTIANMESGDTTKRFTIDAVNRVARALHKEVEDVFRDMELSFTKGRPVGTGVPRKRTAPRKPTKKCAECRTEVSSSECIADRSDCCDATLVA